LKWLGLFAIDLFSQQIREIFSLLTGTPMSSKFIKDPETKDFPSSALRDFFDIWRGLGEEHGLLQKKQFSLTVFAEHLPLMAINDFDPETGLFYVKYFGSEYAHGVGKDFTNSFASDAPNSERMVARFLWLTENKLPYLSLGNRLIWSPKNYKTYNVLACPLFDDRGNVTSLMFRVEFNE
jgi:hypothetical protein